jgi:two-component system, cell cycle response regulator
MPRILTVDDSRSIRMIVSKALGELGFEMGEAEDGNAGLKKLHESSYDLVVLDVTMPNLDGPGMLAKMREGGDKTPVLMLTSESKTSIIAALMKLGIQDYVLKPFKGEELKLKVLKILKLPADYVPAGKPAPAAAAAAGDGAPSAGAAAPSSATRALVVDDMENVHKKVRSMIPAAVVVDASLNANDAMGLCRANKYGLILIDGELPDANLPSLIKQLRLLQPKALMVALALRTANNIAAEMHAQGFDDVLLKPFANEAVEALLEKCFADNQDLVTAQENFVKLAGFHGRDDKLEHYFVRLSAKLKEVVSKLAEACFDSAVLDASALPLNQPLRAGQFVAEVCKAFADSGVSLRIVGSAELATVVSSFEEAKAVRLFNSVEEARAAA